MPARAGPFLYFVQDGSAGDGRSPGRSCKSEQNWPTVNAVLTRLRDPIDLSGLAEDNSADPRSLPTRRASDAVSSNDVRRMVCLEIRNKGTLRAWTVSSSRTPRKVAPVSSSHFKEQGYSSIFSASALITWGRGDEGTVFSEFEVKKEIPADLFLRRKGIFLARFPVWRQSRGGYRVAGRSKLLIAGTSIHNAVD